MRTFLLLLCLASVARAEWFTVTFGDDVHDQGLLADVRARCDTWGQTHGYSKNRLTCCHESTHMVNNQISRFADDSKYHGFYVGNGRACVLKIPKVTLSQVSELVDPSQRVRIYNTYFVNARAWWEKDALYILDEQAAYINGLQTGREENIKLEGDDVFSEMFCHYADCVVEAVKRYDPDYEDMEALEEFVAYQRNRAATLIYGERQ